MTAPRLTSSGLWRAELCPASVVLPATPRRYKDAEAGNAEHKRLEEAAPAGSIPEAKFAYNVLSGEARFIGQGSDREYGPLAEGEIPTTLDLLQIESDHLLITDYKTGVGYMQADPPVNPQLQCQAVAAATVHEKPRALVQLVYTKTGEVKDAEFDALDFAAIHERLLGIWSRVREAAALDPALGSAEFEPLIQEGHHCWRCPAKPACPLKRRARK